MFSGKVIATLGTGKVTAISVAMTAVALFGFSASSSFGALCLWGLPYGLGAGSVDAALNNYVALHYKSRYMNWLFFVPLGDIFALNALVLMVVLVLMILVTEYINRIMKPKADK